MPKLKVAAPNVREGLFGAQRHPTDARESMIGVSGAARAPRTVAVMGRAVMVELTHGFDLLVLVLEAGPVAHLCLQGRVVATLPMAKC